MKCTGGTNEEYQMVDGNNDGGPGPFCMKAWIVERYKNAVFYYSPRTEDKVKSEPPRNHLGVGGRSEGALDRSFSSLTP